MRTLVGPGRRKILLVGGVIAAVLAIVAVRAVLHRADAEEKAKAAQPAAIPVVTATVAKEDVPIFLTGIGTVQPAQTVTVKVRVDGELQKVAFTEGQDVKEGDLLAQIDPRPYQAVLDQAVAQKGRDEATLANAQKDLERYTTLFAQDSIQQQTLDTQKATVNQLKATIQSDQAQIDNARVLLAYTTIRSPVTGRTGLRLVDAGNIVHAADTTGLVVINQIDPIAVVFTLPEEHVPKVNEAMQKAGATPLQAQALGRETGEALATGRLLLVNNQIDTATGTVQLKAQFPNKAHALWPGQYVNVRLVLGTRHDAATVPESAVQRGPEGLIAYVVKPDDSVETRPIRVARTQEGKAIIDDGLAPGTRVIVDGQYKVKPGVKVAEAKQGAPAGPIAQQSEKR
ncbi:MAG: efflux RND transporter periplasmic adaptor subunit [Betaproteobacteria bacterium]|nr:MAG: efflux RND transporter periplasmic adaptor subunit [Betaproteobacteria bacterium]